MSKLRKDVRLAMAGACSGLFSVSLFLLCARVVTFYDYLKFRRTYGYDADYGTEDLWWTPVVVWHVLLSVGASLLIHRYLTTRRTTTFLRWQAIGISSLTGWVLTAVLLVGMECLIQGSTRPIEYAFDMFKFVPVAQFVASVFASNVLYGSAIQAATTESLNESSRILASEV